MSVTGISGVAHATDDDDAGHSSCLQSGTVGSDARDGSGGRDRARRNESSRYNRDLEDSEDTSGRSDRRHRISCGGRGGEPGLNSTSCGSSLLPAGAGVTSCTAPPARRGLDGRNRAE